MINWLLSTCRLSSRRSRRQPQSPVRSPHLLRRLRSGTGRSQARAGHATVRQWERRGVVTLIIAAVLIVVASAIAVVNLATRTPQSSRRRQ